MVKNRSLILKENKEEYREEKEDRNAIFQSLKNDK